MHPKCSPVPCACGCGAMIPGVDRWGVAHQFVNGHFNRVPPGVKLWRPVYRDPEPSACWLRRDGNTAYWQISHNDGALGAHRVAWGLADGQPPPADVDVCHTCDTPGCVRNEPPGVYSVNGVLVPCHGHLFLGTDAVNNADKVAKQRQAAGERNGGARITAATVERIRALYAAGGRSLRSLADAEGVSKSQISRIVNGHSWRLNP